MGLILILLQLAFTNCEPDSNPISCSYYKDCLEPRYSCQSEGYALSYGDKYCHRFLSLNTDASFLNKTLSDLGMVWRDQTMLCLQWSLHTQLVSEGFSSCNQLTTYAFDSHPDCYTGHTPSFCQLRYSDWMIVTEVIDGDDLFSLRSAKQITKVMLSCSTQIFDDYQKLSHKSEEERIDLQRKLKYIEQLNTK